MAGILPQQYWGGGGGGTSVTDPHYGPAHVASFHRPGKMERGKQGMSTNSLGMTINEINNETMNSKARKMTKKQRYQ